MIPELFQERRALIGCAARTSSEKILDVSIPAQTLDTWCWAAVAVGIAAAYNGGDPEKQCSFVGKVINSNCCPARDHSKDECNKPRDLCTALPQHILQELDDPKHCTPEFIKSQIDAGHPVVARIDWKGDPLDHLVVITGYRETVNDFFEVYVQDPDTGAQSRERFLHFLYNYRDLGQWKRSYVTGPGTVAEALRAS